MSETRRVKRRAKHRAFKFGNIDPELLVIDFFCGLGGVTEGFARALALVIMAINHDPTSIKTHQENHPDVTHFNEDVTKLYGSLWKGIWFKSPELMRMIKELDLYRAFYPNAKVLMHGSPDCTHHSKAKGGQSRDADSRTLANYLYFYIKALNPDYITIENVVEFKTWGPVQIKEQTVKYEGLQVDVCPIQWNKNQKSFTPIWVPVEELKGTDFDAWRHAINSFGYHDEWKEINAADLGAFTSRNRLFGCFAKPGLPIVFPKVTHSKKAGKDLFSETQKWKAVREVLDFSIKGKSIIDRKVPLKPKSIDRILKGCIKQLAGGDTSFLSYYYGNGFTTSINEAAGTLTTKDRISLINVEYFIHRDIGTGRSSKLDEPCGTLTTVPKAHLVEADYFILNPSHGGHSTSVDQPCPVVIARQDKAPLYLIDVQYGDEKIPVYKDDCEEMVKLKYFMAYHRIKDITMRMLTIKEMMRIQDMPDWYVIHGKVDQQKKQLGNMVIPMVPEKWGYEFNSALKLLKAI
jgi:DNA (cytosine-5)-methyltransferase 1